MNHQCGSNGTTLGEASEGSGILGCLFTNNCYSDYEATEFAVLNVDTPITNLGIALPEGDYLATFSCRAYNDQAGQKRAVFEGYLDWGGPSQDPVDGLDINIDLDTTKSGFVSSTSGIFTVPAGGLTLSIITQGSVPPGIKLYDCVLVVYEVSLIVTI